MLVSSDSDPIVSTSAVVNGDHRSRVAAAKREKTRLRLLESALEVVRDKGTEAVVIEDFLAAAGVSRGTFYNHFKTTNDLLLALATAMSDEFVAEVNDYLLTCDSPLARLAMGVRLYMHMTVKYPIWGMFLSRVGVGIAIRGQPIEEYVTRDVTDASTAGLIKVEDALAARDLVIGAIFYGVGTMAAEPTHEDHPQHITEAILRGLRAREDLIPTLAWGPLPDLKRINSPLFASIEQA